MNSIDLNCDLGEGYPHDAELMSIITSANIACGGHAGDESTMSATVRLAIDNGVAIGAHPGYLDKENFGRKPLKLSADAIRKLVVDQITQLRNIVKSQGADISHVKPHGALYNQAADDREIASAIAMAVHSVNPSLTVFGLSNSTLLDEARNAGLRVVGEAFADRRYTATGRLASRSIEGAVIKDPSAAAEQALKLARREPISTIDGSEILVEAETVCLHGDGVSAVSTARTIREYLENNGIGIRRYDR